MTGEDHVDDERARVFNADSNLSKVFMELQDPLPVSNLKSKPKASKNSTRD